MRFTVRWVGVILVATVLDLLIRLGSPRFSVVLFAEATLLPLTGLALHLVFRSHPGPSGYRRRLQTVLVWAFLLAGLRAGLWAAGLPVVVANLAVLVVALVAWIGFRVANRRNVKSEQEEENS